MITLTTKSGAELREPASQANAPIIIGLVNNMPDAALHATERQFSDLLAEASRDLPVCLRLFALSELPRSDSGRAYLSERYEDLSALQASSLDGLIVTGAEPRAPMLQDEPYWSALTGLIDWAEDHAASTVWSCLAAHAVVLHRDGIQRRPMHRKLSGVFECEKVGEHPIVAGAPARWSVPHSRYHDLAAPDLVASGYSILSRSSEAGADLFVKQGRSLSIFVQGHPEYDAEALFREYRRDVRSFLAGERENYPDMPCDYFDDATAAEFDEFRRHTLRDGRGGALLNFPETQRKFAHVWHDAAVRLYSNWLSYLVERRHGVDRPKQPHSTDVPHAA